MKRIGITGGIGSGKSVVSRILSINNIPVYDTDSQAKRLQCEDTTLINAIKELLGDESYIDGQLNKPYIASKIFNDKQLLMKVNGLVHPAVIADYVRWCKQKSQEGYQTIGIESAIFEESHLNKYIDELWVVDAPADIRIERACKRDQSSAEKIKARINNQSAYKGDVIICNDDRNSILNQIHKILD